MVLQIIRIRCESAFFRNQNTIVVHVQWTTGPPWISCPAPPLGREPLAGAAVEEVGAEEERTARRADDHEDEVGDEDRVAQ